MQQGFSVFTKGQRLHCSLWTYISILRVDSLPWICVQILTKQTLSYTNSLFQQRKILIKTNNA